jgi:hypothetical protein
VTRLRTARLAAALFCAALLGAAGCGGGGGVLPAGSPGSPPPPPQGSPPPPPPPPPPNEAAPSPPGVTRPALYIERDPDGTVNLRVFEQLFDPFAPAAPQRFIANQKLGPAPGSNNEITGNQTTLISNVDVVRMKYGLQLMGSALVSIYDYSYVQFDGDGSIFGAAIKLGDNNRPTNDATYFTRIFADGMQAPDPNYSVSNTDFIGVEFDSGPLFIRDVTGRNFGDAGIDTKSGPTYVMNATLSSGHRMLRAWPNVEITIANSIINAAPGELQGWAYDNTSTIRYYNTLWCEGSAAPSASDPKCKPDPWLVEGENISPAQAALRFMKLTSNPLPAVSTFFHTSMDEIVVEYSSDGGATWQTLAMGPNTGGPGKPPVGDPRYPIPLNLNAGVYEFRAFYRLNGAKVGETSQVIDETGAVVP